MRERELPVQRVCSLNHGDCYSHELSSGRSSRRVFGASVSGEMREGGLPNDVVSVLIQDVGVMGIIVGGPAGHVILVTRS